MAWLGNTFGDGLTSLKGQVTKLAKEVLSEDPLGTTSFEGRIKELEDICNVHVKEIEQLRYENSRLKSGKSFELSDEQCQNICALETEVSELRAEKEKLEKLLEDLDADHRQELESIAKDPEMFIRSHDWERQTNDSKKQIDELKIALQQLSLQNDILLEDSKSKDHDLNLKQLEIEHLKKEATSFHAKLHNEVGKGKQTLEDVNLLSEEFLQLDEEVKSAKAVIEEKENELQEALNEVNILRNENIELTKEKQKLETHESELANELSTLQGKIDDLVNEIAHLQVGLANEKETVRLSKVKNQEMANHIEKIQSNEEFFSNMIEKLQGENLELVRKVKELESLKVEEHCHYTAIIDRLKEEQNILNARYGELLSSSEKSQQLSNDVAEKQDTEKLGFIDSHQLEVNSLLQKIEKNTFIHNEEVSKLKQSIECLQLEKESLREMLENNTLTYNEEASKLKQSIETLQLEKESLREMLENNTLTYNEEASKLMQSIESLKLEKESLLQKFENNTLSHNEETSKLKQSFESLKLEKESLLQKFESNKRAHIEEVSKLKQSLESLQANCNKLEGEIADLNQKTLQRSQNEFSVHKLRELEDSLQDELGRVKASEQQLSLKNFELEKIVKEQEKDVESLRDEISTLKGDLKKKENDLTSYRGQIHSMEEANRTLTKGLKEMEERTTGKVSVNEDLMKNVEEEVSRIIQSLGIALADPKNLVSCLRSVNCKLGDMVAEQRERCVVHNTLGPEIRKLKGLVNRIRREFMLSSNDQANNDFELHDDQVSGENLFTQSQTDDVKSLTQDVAQMTEIIGMIDRGLASILQDKSRLEKELAIIKTVASTTEKELMAITKAKDAWEEERKLLMMSIQNKDTEILNLTVARDTAEAQIKSLNNELDSIKNNLQAVTEERNTLGAHLHALQNRLMETEQIQEHLKRLEYFAAEQTKTISELTEEKDKLIYNLENRDESVGENSQQNWEAVAKELESKCQRLEQTLGEVQLKEPVGDEKGIADQNDMLSRLQQENIDLKGLVQQLRENIIAMASKNSPDAGSEFQVQQHRRSLSQGLGESVGGVAEGLRCELLQEQSRNQALIEKEASLRKELERLRAHLLEVEEHYTSEAVEREQLMNEYKSKLASAEEQLRNSSTVYTSANVRSTQHLESLQSQVKLMSVQRDDLQTKLSVVEDQVQKQTAALTSLQMVLEQFQLDKERELQSIASKHEYQLELASRHSAELEAEINALKSQLREAQNGLKAGFRLGEQLEKKSQQIQSLEEELRKQHDELLATQKKMSMLSESTAGKVDQFLVKNLVLGYLGASGGNTKTQALKILATVLGLTEEEKARLGVDSQPGWFSSLLHPSPGSNNPSESLSQAFIRFLETESRPQPQLKLLPEASADLTNSIPKRPPLVLSNLVLPTVTPTQVSETSGSALKDVLRDS